MTELVDPSDSDDTPKEVVPESLRASLENVKTGRVYPIEELRTVLMTEPPAVQVQFSAEFKSQLRSLAKRYRQIRNDVQPLIEQLQRGEFPGDQISGTGFTVFKVRIKNSDIRKGKRAGYRVVYQV